MEADLVSLFCIVVIALLAPILSALVPNRMVPETVLLLIAGMLIGPHVLAIAQPDAAITLFSDLGLGFLFLLAGYEINPQELTGKQGRHGLFTWFVTLAIAMVICIATPDFQSNQIGWLAAAIALTTTAFGTLVPILHERGLVETRIGKSIFAYGTWGEIGPIIVIALILSTRKTWVTLAILAAFALVAVAAALIPKRIWENGMHLPGFFERNRDTNAQITVRSVMVLLVGLVMVSALFDLDIVLGAFAAGFVLRFLIPGGDRGLEHKLNGIGYGFFIPPVLRRERHGHKSHGRGRIPAPARAVHSRVAACARVAHIRRPAHIARNTRYGWPQPRDDRVLLRDGSSAYRRHHEHRDRSRRDVR